MERNSWGCGEHTEILEHFCSDIFDVIFGIKVFDGFDGVMEFSIVVGFKKEVCFWNVAFEFKT